VLHAVLAVLAVLHAVLAVLAVLHDVLAELHDVLARLLTHPPRAFSTAIADPPAKPLARRVYLAGQALSRARRTRPSIASTIANIGIRYAIAY
jgi:hypothetical protein